MSKLTFNETSIVEGSERFAKFGGQLQLGNQPVDCYVLDDESRVISMRATVKAIANDDNGDLLKYVSVRSLQSYIDVVSLSEKIIDFSISGNPITAIRQLIRFYDYLRWGKNKDPQS